MTTMDKAFSLNPARRITPPATSNQQDVMSILRRRALLAIIVVTAGIAIGISICCEFLKPAYSSSGLVRVSPVSQSSVDGGPGVVLPMYEAFVKTQIALMQSQQFIEAVMRSPEWKSAGREARDINVEQFAKNFSQTYTQPSELIRVSFTDTDPHVARVAVNAVIHQYEKQTRDAETQTRDAMLASLKNRREPVDAELDNLRQQITTITDKYGTDDLGSLYQLKVSQLSQAQAGLKFARQAVIATASGARGNHAEATMKDLAGSDTVFRGLSEERRRAESDIGRLSLRLGGEHPAVRDAMANLRRLDNIIDQYSSEARAQGGLFALRGIGLISFDDLMGDQQRAAERYREALGELVDVGRTNLTVRNLTVRANTIAARSVELNKRIEQLQMEAAMPGRISIVSTGDRPLTPYRNNLASVVGVGGTLGAMISFALLMIILVTDERLRVIDDLRAASSIPVLGMLPCLPGNKKSSPQLSLSVSLIHKLRVRLQASNNSPRVFSIASATVSTGTTSMATALGASFAASGSRTLLVDCDTVGRGLTARMQEIVSRHRATADDEQESLMAGVDSVQDASVSADWQNALLPSTIPGLWFLAVGTATPAEIGPVSTMRLQTILAQARQQFDVIVLDTGSTSLSPEATLIAREADATVMVVSRGEYRPAFRRAVDELTASGASIVGVVYNRAKAQDVKWHAGLDAWAAALERSQDRSWTKPMGSDSWATLGTIAAAVASHGGAIRKAA